MDGVVILRDWLSLERAIGNLRPRGVVWDFDGVLFDSARLFRELVGERLDGMGFLELGARVRTDHRFVGRDTRDMVVELLGNIPGLDVANCVRELIQKYEGVASERLSLDGRSSAIARRAAECGIVQCIVSNGRPDFIRMQVAKAGMQDAFGRIITPTRVLPPKPAPAMYSFAVRSMKLEVRDCVVIEDSDVGCAAARCAGIPVVRVALFE